MRAWAVPVAALIAAVLAALTDGTDPFGRLTLRAGMPSAAAPLLAEPAMRGVALYRSGQYNEAADAFTEAGPSQTYNRATSLAMQEDFAEALLTYDDLLARDPDHADARANFSLLVSIYSGTELELNFSLEGLKKREGEKGDAPDAQAGARAQGQGADTNGESTDIFAPEVTTAEGVRRVPKVFDDKFIAATDKWLTTMLDQPGAYLKARLRAEQERRRANGTAVPEEKGAW